MARVPARKRDNVTPLLTDRSTEAKLVREIQLQINPISHAVEGKDFLIDPRSPRVEFGLYELSEKVHQLPVQLNVRMANFRDQVRSRYRTWYGFILLSALASLVR